MSSHDVARTLASNASKPLVCCSMNASVQHALAVLALGVVGGEDVLAEAEEDGDVAAGPNLMVWRS